MNLNEILSLEMKQQSIKEIDLYISKLNQNSYQYIKALSYKCLILHHLNKSTEAMKILVSLTANFKSYDDLSIVSICDAIIDITLDLKNTDIALKYIEIKEEHLTELDKEHYYYDLIRYYDLVGSRSDVKRNVISYLNNNLPDDKKIFALEMLIKSQYLDYEYDNFFRTYNDLLGYYIKDFNYEKISELKLLYIKVILALNKTNEAMLYIKEFIDDENTSIDAKVNSASILLDIYIKENEIRKATILESEFHDIYEKASFEAALAFSKKALELAKKIHSNILEEEYFNKIDNLEEIIKEKKKKEKQDKKKQINFNIIENQQIVINKKETFVEKVTDEEPTLIEITSNYKSIEDVIKTFSSRENIKFREIFRNYGIEIENKFSPCEIVIVLYESYVGYHYKKERVYDKQFSDIDLKDTPLKELMDNSNRLFILNIKDSLFDKNIITLKPYIDEIKTVIGFKLYKNEEVLGSIIYTFFTSTFKDKMIYESLKMLTKMLERELIAQISKDNSLEEDKMRLFLYNNQQNGIKIETDKEIILNKQAKEILGFSFDNISSLDYISKIEHNDAYEYKELYNKIYNYEIDEAIIKYHINNRYIKEEIMVERKTLNKIYSVIEDITYIEDLTNDLMDKAYNDELSKMPRKTKLFNDIKEELPTKKFSLALINVSNYKMYIDIYGYSFADEITYAMGKNLLEIIDDYNDISVYHLEKDSFMLLFKNLNDKRSLQSKTYKIIKELTKRLNMLNKRLNLTFNAGAFRYTKAMSVTDVKKIIFYTSEALLDSQALLEEENTVMVYDEEKSAKRFKESQIVLHISEAIDQGLLKIKYRQVVNISTDIVEYYYANINLINFIISEKYFKEVIIKRNLQEMIDKYVILHTINELKTFNQKTGVYFRVIIPIYKSVFNEETFIQFFEGKISFFKIPYDIISIHLIEDTTSDCLNKINYLKKKGITIFSDNFDFTVRNNVDIYLCDIQKYNGFTIEAFKNTLNHLGIQMFGYNVENLDLYKICMESNINILYGNYFKALFSINELIENSKKYKKDE